MTKRDTAIEKIIRDSRKLKRHLEKTYPRFEYHAKQEAGFTYLWVVYDGWRCSNEYVLKIHFCVRPFNGYDNAYIRTKLQNLQLGGTYDYEIVDFDTGIPKAEFNPEDNLDIIGEETPRIIRYFTRYLKRRVHEKII